jgi:peptide/nickel transport system permease protein
MLRYTLNRIATAIVLSIFASLVVFLIASLVPGDPVLAMLGDLAASNPVIVAEYRAKWGLDLPLWEQYWIFLKRLAQGDLGISISTNRSVLADIAQYAPATIELSTIAFILSVAIGVPLGIVPVFWLAFIALTVFYGFLQIAPGPGRLGPIDFPPPTVTGIFLIDAALAGEWNTWRTALAHLVLPSFVLCAATVGLITRTTRASMLDTLGQDYVRVAHAKGLRERAVIIGHALPNALIPVVTLGGLAFANLLTGTVMTETVFSWPGLGRYTFRAAVGLDIPAIMGMTLVFAVVYLLVNLIVDLSYALLDPRVVKR